MKFGFVGATYTNQSKNATGERAINCYPERIETESGKAGARVYLVKIPGLKRTHALPDVPLRCLWSGDGLRAFAVAGQSLYELFEDGTFHKYPGLMEYSASPAQIFANGNELFVISGGKGYVADGLKVFPVISCNQGSYLDGYFIAIAGVKPGDSNTFMISALLDGTSWDALDFAQVEGAPDHIVAVLADHRQIAFFKQQDIEFFWDAGAADQPIQRIDGSYVEQGCVAPWSPKKIDNTIMWLGGDERGGGIVWRMRGFTPERVSNHSVEHWIQSYVEAGGIITDAVGMVDQFRGHSEYHLHFPSVNQFRSTANDPLEKAYAGATWVYDCATGMWHERGRWDTVHGLWYAHPARYHCYVWGKHIVGGGDVAANGRGTGYVFDQSLAYPDDDGKPLRWLRSAPHIADAATKKIFFSNLVIDCQAGVGNAALLDENGNEREPQLMVRHSNDGGNTWGPEAPLAIGKTGEYSFRARQVRCGAGRNRCIEVSGSDPVAISIVDADITAVEGSS